MKHVSKKILVLIPARMGSSRFPGKPMAKILGRPMIGHVYQQVSKSPLVDLVAVATCDQVIYDYIVSIGGKAIMTSSKHERASDRCAEALLSLEKEQGQRYDIVVMVQGDEPMVHPEMIEEALSPILKDPKIKVTNLIAEIKTKEEFEDRNCIKVVCDLESNALYFSREPIPTGGYSVKTKKYKQVCIIPFERDFLIHYSKLKPTPFEIAESVDMMRVLEHGEKIKMSATKHESKAVDTKADLLEVERLMKLVF